MDPFYKFGIYMKHIPGSISSFGLGKKCGGIHGNEAVGLEIPHSNESTWLQSNNPLGACPWCQKLSTNRFTQSNHIRWEHYHLTLICHMCSIYHMPCRDITKSHKKSCNERNRSLVSYKIYSFGEDWPSDAPEPVRINTSHVPEMSDYNTPIKSGKQQSSSCKHSSKVSASKSHTGNISSSDQGTSDSGSESPEDMPTPASKAPASFPKQLHPVSPPTKGSISEAQELQVEAFQQEERQQAQVLRQ